MEIFKYKILSNLFKSNEYYIVIATCSDSSTTFSSLLNKNCFPGSIFIMMLNVALESLPESLFELFDSLKALFMLIYNTVCEIGLTQIIN